LEFPYKDGFLMNPYKYWNEDGSLKE
jgi:hypothetical protein